MLQPTGKMRKASTGTSANDGDRGGGHERADKKTPGG